MQIVFGKFAGKTVEELLLKQPDYIRWCFQQEARGQMLAVQKHAKSLIAKFNAKPIKRICHGKNCESPATRASVYLDSLLPYWWCDSCNPYESGANDGKLQIIRSFEDALQHVDLYCGGKKADQVLILKYLAIGKGMPERVTSKAREVFFA